MADSENLDDSVNEKESPASPSEHGRTLTEREQQRIIRNKEKAKALRASRLVRPYPAPAASTKTVCEKPDTGGGFLLDEEDEPSQAPTRIAPEPRKVADSLAGHTCTMHHQLASFQKSLGFDCTKKYYRCSEYTLWRNYSGKC